MGSRNADVQLVIKARNEADRAISAASEALASLFGEAKETSGGVAELGQTLASLDKIFGSISSKADEAAAAFRRQESTIAANKEQLAAVATQAENAARATDRLRESIVDEVLAGRDQSPIIAQIRLVGREQDALAMRAEKLTRTIATQESALDASRSSLLRLGSSTLAVEDAQAEAAARIALATQAMRDQAEAGQRVTAIQQRINDLVGANRPDVGGSAQTAASVLVEADAHFRLAEARAAEIQRLKDQEAATAALADAEAAERANRARFNITDDPRGQQAAGSMAAFAAAADAETQMEREAAQLRATLDPLGAILERNNAQLARYRELTAAGKLGADDLAAAETRLAREAEQARKALANQGGKGNSLGLSSYELTNLGYQVNDVVTQLASGTGVLRTFGQQGGQILQIFPRFSSALGAAFSNPYFLAAAGVVIGIGLALKQAADQAERLRNFTATINTRPDLSGYDPNDLADQAEALQHLGAKAKDATAAVTALLDGAVSNDAMRELGRAAQETAERLGQSLPEAARAASEAFTGGYDAVAKFDDKLHFLTASEREHIRALFESGNAQAAQTEARLAYQRQEDRIADQSRGPWSQAAHSLGTAWNDLLKFLGNWAPVKIATDFLDSLAGAVKDVGDAIHEALNRGGPKKSAAEQDMERVQERIRKAQAEIVEYEKAVTDANGSAVGSTFQHILDQSRKDLADAQAERGRLEQHAPATANGNPNSTAAKDRADALHQISIEDELQRLRDAGQQRLLTAQEKARREELAGQQAAKDAGDAVVAAAEKRRAVAHETAQIEKESDARAKSAADDRAREIAQFENRVVGAEGGTDKNRNSTAAGYGQFTERTFLDVYRRTPNADASLSDQQVLALRQNETIARGVIDQYARENARFLESFGAKVTAGNLYLAHFLGPAGAKAVLTAAPDTPVDQVVRRLPNAGQVLSGNRSYLRTDGGQGRYRTAGELQSFISDRVSDTGQAQTAMLAEQNRLLDESKRRQDQFNQSVEHGNQDRQQSVAALTAEAGLYGTALLAEQRRQAVAKAELDLQQKAEDANRNVKPGESPVVVTDDQVAKAKALAAALFDAQHAKEALAARVADVQRPVDDLQGQRDALKAQADFLHSIGDNNGVEAVNKQIDTLTPKLQQAMDALIAFYEALRGDDKATERGELGIQDPQQLDNIIAKLQQSKQSTQEWGRIAGVSGQQIAQSFASSAASSFTSFINKVAAGKNVFKALGSSVREFAANFISSIAQMILQLLAFATAVTTLRALGVPVPSSAMGLGQLFGSHHTGGTVGNPKDRRNVSPTWFTGAMRYHTGGIAGLRPNEVPIIAERGEEVLTTADPRHRANGGLQGPSASPAGVTLINVTDPAQVLEQALRTPAGEKVFINHVRDNQNAFKAALG